MSDTSEYDTINWPDDIDEGIFLDQYWQKKPLLIRQAFPDFDTPLPADELAGLSLEPDVTGRIITREKNGAYRLEHGPFEEERFAALTDNQWSLLVTDIEKHLPDFIEYLQPFRFIPDWRIDDLMISYAPEGASVGAHVDEYDVFLLQGSGIRQWHIDARNDKRHSMRADGDLKILDNFEATHSWDLQPGDMLYLPPGMAHHGIAKGDDCTTWSIGFRAPRLSDFVARMAEMVSDTMATTRYTDGPITPARKGEISANAIQRFKSIWHAATQLDDDAFAQLLGSWLTESNATAPESVTGSVNAEVANNTAEITYQKAPFSRFAWIQRLDGSATLFADGVMLICTMTFAQQLCGCAQWFKVIPASLNQKDTNTLRALRDMGCLFVPDDP